MVNVRTRHGARAAARRGFGRQRRSAARGFGVGFRPSCGVRPTPRGPADGRERSGPPDAPGSPRRSEAPAPARCEDNWSRPVERFAQHPHTVKARPRPGINRHVHVQRSGHHRTSEAMINSDDVSKSVRPAARHVSRRGGASWPPISRVPVPGRAGRARAGGGLRRGPARRDAGGVCGSTARQGVRPGRSTAPAASAVRAPSARGGVRSGSGPGSGPCGPRGGTR